MQQQAAAVNIDVYKRQVQEVDGVSRCCCVYDAQKERLHGFYTGAADKAAVRAALAQRLPVFMLPRTLEPLDSLPLTENGKTDRKRLLAMARKEIV